MSNNLPALYVKPETVITQAVKERVLKSDQVESRHALEQRFGLVCGGIGIIIFVGRLYVLSDGSPIQPFDPIFGVALAFLLLALFFLRNERRPPEVRTDVPFQCPACLHRFDINQQWTCGNCYDEGHGKKKVNTPLHGCASKHCPDRKQSALQCPGCSCHLIIDPKGYAVRGTSEPPYPGAARMKNDNKTPITGSSSPQDGTNLQSLFKGL